MTVRVFFFVYCSYDWRSGVAKETNNFDLCESQFALFITFFRF